MSEQDLMRSLKELQVRIEQTRQWFDLDNLRNQIKVLEREMSEPDFWADQTRARKVSAEHDDLQTDVETFENLVKGVNNALEIATLDQGDKNVNLREELQAQYTKLAKSLEKLELKKLLGGEYDNTSAMLAIHAGAGGTDAQDWAEMLRRMYLRFAETMKWQTEILDESRGQEAGIKSCLIKVSGRNAYGYLKCEAGVHRLVRISPFDAEKMRHTSFALVEVLPELPDTTAVEIDPKDLRIDTFMSGGHGGQSVNTTYSAVRIVHIPTGITVQCQNERSQMQNKAQAMSYLRAKLWQLAEDKLQSDKKKLRGEFKSAEWGNQARSYVLHPYKLVKDHRTGYEVTNPDEVLNGELLEFIEERLKQIAGSR